MADGFVAWGILLLALSPTPSTKTGQVQILTRHARASLAEIIVEAAPEAKSVPAIEYTPAVIAAAGGAANELERAARQVANLGERMAFRDLMLSDDELDELWIAIRHAPRELSNRENAFLAHFGNTPESWAGSYESSDEYRALKRRLAG
jgi:hypothetical protein